MDLFIPKETLDLLSYRSTLGQSLKQISLSATPINLILDDIARYRAGYIDTPTTAALSSALMMCLVFGFASMSIQLASQTISELLICGMGNRWMMVTVRSIFITSGIIWHTR